MLQILSKQYPLQEMLKIVPTSVAQMRLDFGLVPGQWLLHRFIENHLCYMFPIYIYMFLFFIASLNLITFQLVRWSS